MKLLENGVLISEFCLMSVSRDMNKTNSFLKKILRSSSVEKRNR